MPSVFRGVVFCCPMCKISPDMLPAAWVVDALCWLIGPSSSSSGQGGASFLGAMPLAPARQNIGDVGHKIRDKADLIDRTPLSFCRNPRLATARELIRVTQRISRSLADFDASFLVMHGLADRVTDPMLSQALFDEAKSKDKSIRLYEGMCHGLTSTEPNENIDRVFNDAIEWILLRA
jgi:acylglycerol lipase